MINFCMSMIQLLILVVGREDVDFINKKLSIKEHFLDFLAKGNGRRQSVFVYCHGTLMQQYV